MRPVIAVTLGSNGVHLFDMRLEENVIQTTRHLYDNVQAESCVGSDGRISAEGTQNIAVPLAKFATYLQTNPHRVRGAIATGTFRQAQNGDEVLGCGGSLSGLFSVIHGNRMGGRSVTRAGLERFRDAVVASGNPGNPSCTPYVCDGTSANCPTFCSVDGNCAAGHYCKSGVCALLEMDGVSCSGGNVCQSGNCVDGFCCNTTCSNACDACDVGGLEGPSGVVRT